jgi:leucyl aminopeptidase
MNTVEFRVIKNGEPNPHDVWLRPAFADDLTTHPELQLLQGFAAAHQFAGKAGQVLPACGPMTDDERYTTVLHVGMGNRKSAGIKEWNKTTDGMFARLASLDVDAATLILPSDLDAAAASLMTANAYDIGRKIGIEAVRAGYHFSGRTEVGGYKPKKMLRRLAINASRIPAQARAELERGLNHGKIIGESTSFARTMINEDPEVCDADYMVAQAEGLVREFPSLKLTVINRERAAELGMGAFLGVAKAGGAAYVIALDHEPDTITAQGKPVFVGKGICFDTGGIDVKPADGMLDMRYDMGGAGTVMANARTVSAFGIPMRFGFILPCCKNLIGPNGTLPSTKLVTASGKTIWVENTDAEGRLVLADGMWLARTHHGATKLITVATLTGAIRIALGTKMAGMFATDDDLANLLLASSAKTGEQLWRMPFTEDHLEQIRVPWADVTNTGGREGGACTAFALLQEFNGGLPYAHLDVAGPVWGGKKIGATGYGIPMLADASERLYHAAWSACK